MHVARLTCSDPECAMQSVEEASAAAELECLVCECGCVLEVIGWPDWVDEPAPVVALRMRTPPAPPDLHAAA